MRLRGILLLAFGVVTAGLVLVAFMAGRLPGVPAVCPAIGYAYPGPVELVFPTTPTSVAACFGGGCTPQPVSAGPDGKWLVPQSDPYLTPPASVTSISVEATDSSGARISRVLSVESESTGEHPYGPACGGPFRFKPVRVPLG